MNAQERWEESWVHGPEDEDPLVEAAEGWTDAELHAALTDALGVIRCPDAEDNVARAREVVEILRAEIAERQ